VTIVAALGGLPGLLADWSPCGLASLTAKQSGPRSSFQRERIRARRAFFKGTRQSISATTQHTSSHKRYSAQPRLALLFCNPIVMRGSWIGREILFGESFCCTPKRSKSIHFQTAILVHAHGIRTRNARQAARLYDLAGLAEQAPSQTSIGGRAE
jgi:hypothetical protein